MAHFTKVKTPKGATRYVTRWSENGKTRQKNFLTQKEAKHYSVEMEQKLGQRKKLRHKEYLRIGDIDFRQVAKKFLAEKKNPVRGDPVEPITLRGYKSYLKEHIYPATDGYYIRGIAATHFERAFDLAAKKQCSPKTKREILRLMTAVLKHAQGLGYIESVPTHTVEIRPTRAEKIKAKLDADKKPYSPNEIYSLLRAADSLAMDENRQTQKVWARYRPMVYFLTYTGARISETRGFPRADYEKETGFIRISQSAPETGAVGNVKAVDSIRRIPLNPALIEPLDEALARHDRSLVFGTLTNMPISNSNLYSRLLSPLKDRADTLAKSSCDPRQIIVSRDRAFHGFRHHYASWLVNVGANLKQLQTYMGHADPAFTLKVYGHLFDDDGKDLVANMTI